MNITIENELLGVIWESLNDNKNKSKTFECEIIFRDILDSGWVFPFHFDDVLYFLDDRLTLLSSGKNFNKLCALLDIYVETIYDKPKSRENSAFAYQAISVENLTSILIFLEKLGFSTDATYLVDKLLPLIEAKKNITSSELDIIWFKKTQYKNSSVVLSTKDWFKNTYFNTEIKTEKGFKINAQLDNKKNPVFLEISAPKFKRRQNPVEILCPDCGETWFKGDTSSSASHRKTHKRLMSFLNPQPIKVLLNSNINNDGYIVVRTDSPKWQHKEMYERAYAFKKEFNYDFVQWQRSKEKFDPNVFGYLFTDVNNAIIGACSFRFRETNWGLQWIWICPKERRKKHLSNKWKMFKEKFGNFIVEPPISNEMKAFIKTHANQ